ncbi:MAG: hypothetical protein HKP58_17560 [Desulfatitalea sp.]|nr:hypothetical protein [Desulfatitalea sp.]NNK02222.1 hypothetical protein [Desulfatitalea sp.]
MTFPGTALKAVREDTYNKWKLGGKPYPVMSRKQEYQHCREKYPQIPKSMLLKDHCVNIGVKFTETAWRTFDERKEYKQRKGAIFQKDKYSVASNLALPVDFRFADGTSVLVCVAPEEKDPYIIDYIDDRFWLMADDEVYEEIHFPLKPKFYDKQTSKGTLMSQVGMCTNVRNIHIIPYHHCHYFTEGLQCRMCDMDHCTRMKLKLGGAFKIRINEQDTYELVYEALKEEGRFKHIFLTGGSDPRADFQEEFDFHLALVNAVTRAAREHGVESCSTWPIMSPVRKDQMKQFQDAGAAGFGIFFEIWGKEKWEIMCPGKAKHVGWEEWIKRTLDAVEVFGKGNVHCSFVAGTEMMYGYNDIQDAVTDTLAGCEFLLQNGCSLGDTILTIEPGSELYNTGQMEPPLEFYCKLVLGRNELIKKYGIIGKMCWYDTMPYSMNADITRLL